MLFRKAVVVAAIVAGSMSSAALASPQPKYVLKRIPGGPRPDQYVLVRTHEAKERQRPYALTGNAEERREHRVVSRPTPMHPKGTHGY